MEIHKKSVGNRIKSIRKSKGMTLEEFGKLFTATKGNVSLWENGSSIPNNERLVQIAKIGGISVGELLYGDLESNLINVVNEKLLNYNAVQLSKETKEEVKKSAIDQALKNPLIHATYEDRDEKTFNSFVDDEIEQSIIRFFNKVDFTNNGFIRFIEIELNSLNSKKQIYSYNGINEELYEEVTTMINTLLEEINDLKNNYIN